MKEDGMVDLEQFREAAKCWRRSAAACGSSGDVKEADRLLSIIDSAGKVEAEPSAVRSLVAAANAVLALYPGDDLLWTLESAVRPFNATKPAECAKECPPQQVCDYCQIASTAQQPAVVVDDAMVERAWLAGMREYARLSGGLEDEPNATDLAAMRAALTTALSSVQGVESP